MKFSNPFPPRKAIISARLERMSTYHGKKYYLKLYIDDDFEKSYMSKFKRIVLIKAWFYSKKLQRKNPNYIVE